MSGVVRVRSMGCVFRVVIVNHWLPARCGVPCVLHVFGVLSMLHVHTAHGVILRRVRSGPIRHVVRLIWLRRWFLVHGRGMV